MKGQFCWVDGSIFCQEDDCSNCEIFLGEFSMIVYCNDKDCPNRKELPFKKKINWGRGRVPFEEDGYTGICLKKEIAVDSKTVETTNTKYRYSECRNRSDMKISGHMDFSRFPQGGNIG